MIYRKSPPEIKFDPIHEAAKAGDNEEIKRILSEGVNIDLEEKYYVYNARGGFHGNLGRTPIQIAFDSNQIDTARLLIDMGADVHKLNGVDTWEQQSRKEEFYDNLLGRFNQTNYNLKVSSFVDKVVNFGSLEWIKLLEEKNIFVNGARYTERLRKKITPEELEFFLSRGADVNAIWSTKSFNSNSNAFHVHGDNPESLRILLSYGLNPDKRNIDYTLDSFRESVQKRYDSHRHNKYNLEQSSKFLQLLRVLDEPVERKYPSFSPGAPKNINLEEDLEKMEKEVSEITSKMSTINREAESRQNTINSLSDKIKETGNNLAICVNRKEELENLLHKSESLLNTRNRTIRECEAQKLELEQDVASISARLLMENSELSDDVVEARDRLRLALEAAALNSNSVQLGTLIKEMSDFMNSGDMNNYQLSIMESIMEENIRQATSPERIELLRIIFVKIKDEVRDRKTSIMALKYLESNEFKVGMLTKIGAHMRLF